MSNRTVDVAGFSVEEAMRLLKGQVRRKEFLVSHKVVSAGTVETTTVRGATSKEAYSRAKSNLPSGAIVLSEREVHPPSSGVMAIAAEDEEDARRVAICGSRDGANAREVRLARPAKRGFLRIGKASANYEVVVDLPAVYEMTYRLTATVRAVISEWTDELRLAFLMSFLPSPILDSVLAVGATSILDT